MITVHPVGQLQIISLPIHIISKIVMLYKGLFKYNSFLLYIYYAINSVKSITFQDNTSSKYLIHDMAIRVCPSGDGCTPSGAQYSGVLNEQSS